MINRALGLKTVTLKNRILFQPMEGFDCNGDGSPGELTIRKYLRFAKSGAGVIWFEANAICAEGRTNARQMQLTQNNLDRFRELTEKIRSISLKESGFAPVLILQLTHSGRQSVKPIGAYSNSFYNSLGKTAEIADDDYLSSLPELFYKSTKLAQKAGFDGVDVKCCHGYLLSESLSAYQRQGIYGGSFENRTRLFYQSIQASKAALEKNKLLCSRFGAYDGVKKPYGFAAAEDGAFAAEEPIKIARHLAAEGVDILNITVGNPYYNPHVNRPYLKGSYKPPESAQTGLQRFIHITKTLNQAVSAAPNQAVSAAPNQAVSAAPNQAVKDATAGGEVAQNQTESGEATQTQTVSGEAAQTQTVSTAVAISGMSYYRSKILDKADQILKDGVCSLIGFGRLTLAYPDFYKDAQNKKSLPNKYCIVCSKCTELMRAGFSAGCAVFDPIYKQSYKENILCKK